MSHSWAWLPRLEEEGKKVTNSPRIYFMDALLETKNRNGSYIFTLWTPLLETKNRNVNCETKNSNGSYIQTGSYTETQSFNGKQRPRRCLCIIQLCAVLIGRLHPDADALFMIHITCLLNMHASEDRYRGLCSL